MDVLVFKNKPRDNLTPIPVITALIFSVISYQKNVDPDLNVWREGKKRLQCMSWSDSLNRHRDGILECTQRCYS